jgi:hypothetical protein
MRLHELFEDPFTIPGISYVLNDPQDVGAAGQNSGNTATPAVINKSYQQSQAKTAPIGPGAAPSASSLGAAPPTTAPAPGPELANAQQQLAKGASITVPVGPAKQPIHMKITNVSNNDATKGKTVTVADPQKPNQPEQTYSTDDLAAMIANRGKQ